MTTKIFCQILKQPAKCRSAALREAGVLPSAATAYKKVTPVNVEIELAEPVSMWRYIPGNTPETAIVVDRGYWVSNPDPPYYSRSYNPATERYETHKVWVKDVCYICQLDETREHPVGSAAWSLDSSFEEALRDADDHIIYDVKDDIIYTTETK